jgi:hypothetical protein
MKGIGNTATGVHVNGLRLSVAGYGISNVGMGGIVYDYLHFILQSTST